MACEPFEKMKKMSYALWAFASSVVFLVSTVFNVTSTPVYADNGLFAGTVRNDINGSRIEEAPGVIGDEDMDAAWATVAMPQDFACYIGERAITAENAIVGNKMYIGIADAIREFIPEAGIVQNRYYVSASAAEFSLCANAADKWIVVNGRYIPCDYVSGESGALMMPLSVVSKIFITSLEISDDNSKAVFSESEGYILSGDEFYAEKRLYWLSRIISAESRGESIIGKIAVGNVVMNRVASAGFPGTVYDVIFDTSCGVQFTPTADGSIFNEPDKESVIAAKLCLEGYSLSKNILFFLNPSTASNSWISENRTFVTTIGRHEFYS